jgi:hypothetical protein
VVAEHLAKRRVEKVGGGVIRHGGEALRPLDDRATRVPSASGSPPVSIASTWSSPNRHLLATSSFVSGRDDEVAGVAGWPPLAA